jgi:hypothetical protein
MNFNFESPCSCAVNFCTNYGHSCCQQVADWVGKAHALLEEVAKSESPLADKAKEIL